MHLFLATDLTAIPGYTGPDTDERIEVQRVALADVVAMAAAGRIEDAKTMLSVFWLDRLVSRGDVTL